MINAIIQWSLHNRFFVLLATIILTGWGFYSVKETPIDAIPNLSDVQVIVKTSYPGQAPQVVEDQVTYPLTTAMLSVPGAKTVRGYSFFGDSFVYVIFDAGTDLYWARSRVLEYLSQVAGQLPDAAKPELGPDATGVGWVYSYALVDRSGQHDLAQLRAIQDWFLKFELQTVPGVSEAASVGGMVKQYQIVVDLDRLRAHDITLQRIHAVINKANQETGASVVEMAEAEYMLRVTGYLQNEDDLRQVPLGVNDNGKPLLLKDVADVQLGPQIRRGIADLNGEGEVAGGIVVMRSGENALETIEGIKQRLKDIQASLPEGVEVVPTYDRSTLINNAVDNFYGKLLQEFLVVILICAVFLFHLRSSLVFIVSLPVGILAAFVVMHAQGINANIMSLGGIAIAIGAMVDGAIVMVENVHKHMERTPLTPESLRKKLDKVVRLPGLTNAWVMPIKTRIDMLSTGIKTPVGIKVAGPDLSVIQNIGQELEQVLSDIPGTASVFSERVAGGRYIKVDIQREAAARFGLNIGDIHSVVRTAIQKRSAPMSRATGIQAALANNVTPVGDVTPCPPTQTNPPTTKLKGDPP